MTASALGAAVEDWGVLAAVIASLGGVVVALWQAYNSRRAGVSGDEREARVQEQVDRRDTIADRDSMIDQLTEDCSIWRQRALSAESRETHWIAVVSGHVPWDWAASQIAHEAGRAAELGVAPPLRPPSPPQPRNPED